MGAAYPRQGFRGCTSGVHVPHGVIKDNRVPKGIGPDGETCRMVKREDAVPMQERVAGGG